MGAEVPNTHELPQLKYLEPVKSYTEFAFSKTYGIASTVYNKTKPYVPKRVLGVSDKLTERISVSVTKGGDYASKTLQRLDTKVDGVAKFVHSNQDYLVQQQKAFSDKNLGYFKSAREAYLARVEQAVEFVKKNGVKGTAQSVLDSISKTLSSAKNVPDYLSKEAKALVDQVYDAWNNLYSSPAVQKIKGVAGAPINVAWRKYQQAHNRIVSTPLYAKAVNTGAAVVSKVQHTYVYKTAANRLYPIVAPIADPALNKVNPYYTAVVDHLKPATA